MNAIMATLVLSTALGAEPAQSNWEANYGVALNAARETKKPLLIVIEDSKQPKSRIEQVRFNKASLQDELLSPFTLCRVDVSTEYGKKVAAAFETSEFPFTAITNRGATKIVYKHTGTYSTDQWVSTLISHKNVTTVSTRSYSRSTGRQRLIICNT